MKKLSLLFLAAAVISFTACNEEPKSTEPTQEQLDSIANAKAAADAVMQQTTDSLNAAIAKLKEDSAAMAVQRQMDSVAEAAAKAAGKKVPPKKNVATKPTQPKPTAPVEPTKPNNPKGDKMNSGSTSGDDKRGKMNGTAEQTNTQGKKNKMNGNNGN